MGRRSYADERFWIEEDEVSHVDVMCYGKSTGSLAVIVHGGVPPYQFSIDGENWQSEEYFDNLPVPSNAVKSTDEYGGIWIGEYTMYCKDSRDRMQQVVAYMASPVQLRITFPTLTNAVGYDVLFVADAGQTYVTIPDTNVYKTGLTTIQNNARVTSTKIKNQYDVGNYSLTVAVRNDCMESDSLKYYFRVAPRRLTNAIQDYDGNWYDAVIIGEQVWLGSDLRTTHSPSGQVIETSETGYSVRYKFDVLMNGDTPTNNNPSGVRGISPNGWHIPSNNEWEQLINYLKTIQDYIYGDNNDNIAKSLAATSIWGHSDSENAVGNDLSLNNRTLMSIYPLSSGNNYFQHYYTCSLYTQTRPYIRVIESSKAVVSTSTMEKTGNCCVRCVCDMNALDFIKWYWNTYGSFDHQLS